MSGSFSQLDDPVLELWWCYFGVGVGTLGARLEGPVTFVGDTDQVITETEEVNDLGRRRKQ